MHSTICIGRNVRGKPMPENRWIEFMTELMALVSETAECVFNEATGVGHWEDEVEDTFVITFMGGTPGLGERLVLLARRFEQEAIAWISGTCQLVAANEADEVLSA